MFCLRLRQSFCLKSTNQRQNGSAKSYHVLCYSPVIWCKLNSARNNRFILGNLCFATNKNILFWKGREIQLLLRGSASPTSWVSFCMKSCCPLLPFFLSKVLLSLSLQGNDPQFHAAHILEFTAWLISQGHAQPKYWLWSSLARQLAQKHFRRKRRGGRNPLASLRTKLVYY